MGKNHEQKSLDFNRCWSILTCGHNKVMLTNGTNSTMTHSKNLSVFTLNPKGNSQIFLLTSGGCRNGVNQEKNQTPTLICQSRTDYNSSSVEINKESVELNIVGKVQAISKNEMMIIFPEGKSGYTFRDK